MSRNKDEGNEFLRRHLQILFGMDFALRKERVDKNCTCLRSIHKNNTSYLKQYPSRYQYNAHQNVSVTTAKRIQIHKS